MEIAELIKARRKDLGLTQAQAAQLAGVSARFVFDVENGKQTIAMDRLTLLLDALGLEMKIGVANLE